MTSQKIDLMISDAVHTVVTTSKKADLFGNVVEKFDMVCIASKCNKECQACSQCTYASEQMSALAQGEPTSGLCPKLETCVQSCLEAGDLPKILKCVADRCNVHCYDGDCPSCRAMAKRMFTIICLQTDMLNLSHIQYTGTCPRFFNDLADEYVAARRRVAV
nr:CRE-DCT-5 protein [Haemonchus contortus]